MNVFLKLGSILFHPLLIPLIGSIIYFNLTPRFIEPELITSQLLAISIATIAVPLVTYFLLRSLGQVESIYLRSVQERKYPLMIQCILLLLVIKLVFSPYTNPEVYYFFVGILFTALTALIMVFFKLKASLHQAGMAGILFFTIGLSAHFKINLLTIIGLFLFANGWVASSRLHAKAHTYPELGIGFLIGAFPQFVLYNLWL